MGHTAKQHFFQLDGWRGISILFVLSAHLLPLGPSEWMLNQTSGRIGMALFFTLSGFLIVHFLQKGMTIKSFLIRRFFRIAPLVYLYLIIIFTLGILSSHKLLSFFLFYANWPPMTFDKGSTSHLWSLCIEMQFYIFSALVCGFFGRKSLLLVIPLMAISVTGFRIYSDVYAAVNTYYRADELFAGGILALIYNSEKERVKNFLSNLPPLIPVIGLLVSSHPLSGDVNFLRPYMAALAVGATLYNTKSFITENLNSKVLFYIATISYALYVIHPVLAHHSWLGIGDGIEKYIKRLLLFVVLFLLAHASTFYFEKPINQLARKLTKPSK